MFKKVFLVLVLVSLIGCAANMELVQPFKEFGIQIGVEALILKGYCFPIELKTIVLPELEGLRNRLVESKGDIKLEELLVIVAEIANRYIVPENYPVELKDSFRNLFGLLSKIALGNEVLNFKDYDQALYYLDSAIKDLKVIIAEIDLHNNGWCTK